jgi:MYXO-CTERM domain-containing protein
MKRAIISLFTVALLSTSMVTALPLDWVQAIAVNDDEMDRTGRTDQPMDNRVLDRTGMDDNRVDRTTGYPPRTVAETDADDDTSWGWLGLLGLLGLLGRRRREERDK